MEKSRFQEKILYKFDTEKNVPIEKKGYIPAAELCYS